MSSATPSSSTSDDGLASCLLFTVEVSEYRFLGPPRNRADDLAYIASLAMDKSVFLQGYFLRAVLAITGMVQTCCYVRVLGRVLSYMVLTPESESMRSSIHGAPSC